MNAEAKAARRAFVLRETKKLGAFLGDLDVAGWHREYRCSCGFRCTTPHGIWDHTATCTATGRAAEV